MSQQWVVTDPHAGFRTELPLVDIDAGAGHRDGALGAREGGSRAGSTSQPPKRARAAFIAGDG